MENTKIKQTGDYQLNVHREKCQSKNKQTNKQMEQNIFNKSCAKQTNKDENDFSIFINWEAKQQKNKKKKRKISVILFTVFIFFPYQKNSLIKAKTCFFFENGNQYLCHLHEYCQFIAQYSL